MREIVGAMIGTTITNNRAVIRRALEAGTSMQFLDRQHMQFMAGCDLGRNWELMADGPTLFYLDDEGKPCTTQQKARRSGPLARTESRRIGPVCDSRRTYPSPG